MAVELFKPGDKVRFPGTSVAGGMFNEYVLDTYDPPPYVVNEVTDAGKNPRDGHPQRVSLETRSGHLMLLIGEKWISGCYLTHA